MRVVSIKGTQIELTDAIKDYVNLKLTAVEKFTTDFGESAEISIECGRTSTHHNKGMIFRCEANLQLPNKLIRIEREAENLYEAIDLVKDDLIRQIKDFKGILTDKSKRAQRPDKM